jgi:hypothetical protein
MFNYDLSNKPIRPGETREALYLSVPTEYAGIDGSEPMRSWGLHLIVHYPDMTGVLDPRNRGRLGTCAGYCPGEMDILITYRHGNAKSGAAAWLTYYDNLKTNPAFRSDRYVETTKLPFTNVVTKIINSDETNPLNQRQFLVKSGDSISFFAVCSYNTPTHLCKGYTSAHVIPDVELEYTFLLEDVSDFQSIQDKVVDFVDSLLVKAERYTAN